MSDAVDKPKTKPMVALEEGICRLIDSPVGRPALLGSRCPKCTASYLPKRETCIACGQNGLDEAALSGRGKIWPFARAVEWLGEP